MNARRAKDLLVTLQHQWELRTHSGKMYRRADGITWPPTKRSRTSACGLIPASIYSERPVPGGTNGGDLNGALGADPDLDWMLMADGDLLSETCDRDLFSWDPSSVMMEKEVP